jgi:hypothetical protein
MIKKCSVYRVKPDGSWFIGNTFAILLDDYRPSINGGLFLGTTQSFNPESTNRPYGEIYEDEEDCGFDEFDEEPFGIIEFDYKGYVKNGMD